MGTMFWSVVWNMDSDALDLPFPENFIIKRFSKTAAYGSRSWGGGVSQDKTYDVPAKGIDWR